MGRDCMKSSESRIIYLDHNATTPCAPEAVEAMVPFLREEYANPASPHVMGRRANAAVEKAREQVAMLVGCAASEIIFTGGATESNNIVLLGVDHHKRQRDGIVVSCVEHKSVLAPCERLEEHGFPVLTIPVDSQGRISVDAAKAMISERTFLVSIQAANNEVGTIQPVCEVARVAREVGALVHCDAAQGLGKIPFDVNSLGLDFASFSAHKLYGPKGIGALYIRNGRTRDALRPILLGGGQESGLRSGTLNVPAIVGMGEACRLASIKLAEGEADRLRSLRDSLEESLCRRMPGIMLNGRTPVRLPGTTSITLPGMPADLLVANLPRVCLGSGSACTSRAVSPSHVLIAMGRSREEAQCTIRLSVRRYNGQDEMGDAANRIAAAVTALRHRLEPSHHPK